MAVSSYPPSHSRIPAVFPNNATEKASATLLAFGPTNIIGT